jgi:succinate dehydrogenase / fumarate reductase flavoprotein subunit
VCVGQLRDLRAKFQAFNGSIVGRLVLFDMVVVGAGGAGLRATFGLAAKGLKTVCITKVFPTRSTPWRRRAASRRRARQHGRGRLALPLLRHHQGIRLARRPGRHRVHVPRSACPAIIELEHYGVPFSRTDEGKIYQRPFGGMTTKYGEGPPAERTCAAADRTGHAMLHTLYQQSLAHDAQFMIEYFALDLIWTKTACAAACWPGHGRRHPAPVPRPGRGAGHRRLWPRLFQRTSAHTCTGDGGGMALRAGLAMQDMEFVQFHPTGIYGAGCLITEGVRGEGGILRNSNGERFMERYAPHYKDLASRDVVSRSMTIEIREGRGVGEHKDHILLDLTHLGPGR